jgi:Family of unknown function (DUF6011)
MSTWKWIYHGADTLYDVGVNPDGSLHNPNGYPADTVRAAIAAAEQRRAARRSKGAKKAAETRRIRQDRRVHKIAQQLLDGHAIGPARHCVVCQRGLDDPESIQRGIGSECWQSILDRITEATQPAIGPA